MSVCCRLSVRDASAVYCDKTTEVRIHEIFTQKWRKVLTFILVNLTAKFEGSSLDRGLRLNLPCLFRVLFGKVTAKIQHHLFESQYIVIMCNLYVSSAGISQ